VPDKIAATGEGSVAGPAFVPPKWRKPAPLGYGGAIDSVGTVGSSLLAGFSLASVIVVTSAARQFRWPGAAVLALSAAGQREGQLVRLPGRQRASARASRW
jgi:hypothetical protein